MKNLITVLILLTVVSCENKSVPNVHHKESINHTDSMNGKKNRSSTSTFTDEFSTSFISSLMEKSTKQLLDNHLAELNHYQEDLLYKATQNQDKIKLELIQWRNFALKGCIFEFGFLAKCQNIEVIQRMTHSTHRLFHLIIKFIDKEPVSLFEDFSLLISLNGLNNDPKLAQTFIDNEIHFKQICQDLTSCHQVINSLNHFYSKKVLNSMTESQFHDFIRKITSEDSISTQSREFQQLLETVASHSHYLIKFEEELQNKSSFIELSNNQDLKKAFYSVVPIHKSEISLEILILEWLFKGKISPLECHQLWDKLKLRRTNFFDDVNFFYQFFFMTQVVRSHQTMSAFLNNKNVPRKYTLINDTISASKTIKAQWKTFHDNMDKIKRFLTIISQDQHLSYSELFNVTNLNKKIDYYVTLQHLLILSYHMVIEKFTALLYGIYKIDHRVIISLIFNGVVKDWFNYKISSYENGTGIDIELDYTPTDLLVSFDLALKTGTFEIFKIDTPHFINLVTFEASRPIIDKIQKGVMNLNYTFQNMKREINEIQTYCSNKNDYRFNLKFTDLKNGFFPYADETTSLLTRNVSGQYIEGTNLSLSLWTQNISELVEYLRSDLGQYMELTQDMLKFYENELNFRNDPHKTEKLKRAFFNYDQSKHLSRLVYTKILHFSEQYLGNCLSKMIRDEFDTQLKLYKNHEMYFRWVWRKYNKQQGRHKIDISNDVQMILQEARVDISSTYTGHTNRSFTGLDYIEDGVYYFHQIDALFRTAIFLSFGKDYDHNIGTLGPVHPQFKIKFPQYGLRNIGALKNPISMPIKMIDHENEDEFVNEAIKLFTQTTSHPSEGMGAYWNNKVVDWLVTKWGYDGLNLNYYIHLMTLFKAGKIEHYDIRLTHCLENTPRSECPIMTSNFQNLTTLQKMLDFAKAISLSDEEVSFFEKTKMKQRGYEYFFEAFTFDNNLLYLYAPGFGIFFNPSDPEVELGLLDYGHLINANVILGNSLMIPWIEEALEARYKTAPTLSLYAKSKQLLNLINLFQNHIEEFKPTFSMLKESYSKRLKREWDGISSYEFLANQLSQNYEENLIYKTGSDGIHSGKLLSERYIQEVNQTLDPLKKELSPLFESL